MKITPATTNTHGPFKKVARVVDEVETTPARTSISRSKHPYTKEIVEREIHWPERVERVVYEVLECGHRGETLARHRHPWDDAGLSWLTEPEPRPARKRRRCFQCRVPVCNVCGEPASEEKGPITSCLPVWGYQEAHADVCLAVWQAEQDEEDAHWARVREENLARRRAAGEDV